MVVVYRHIAGSQSKCSLWDRRIAHNSIDVWAGQRAGAWCSCEGSRSIAYIRRREAWAHTPQELVETAYTWRGHVRHQQALPSKCTYPLIQDTGQPKIASDRSCCLQCNAGQLKIHPNVQRLPKRQRNIAQLLIAGRLKVCQCGQNLILRYSWHLTLYVYISTTLLANFVQHCQCGWGKTLLPAVCSILRPIPKFVAMAVWLPLPLATAVRPPGWFTPTLLTMLPADRTRDMLSSASDRTFSAAQKADKCNDAGRIWWDWWNRVSAFALVH